MRAVLDTNVIVSGLFWSGPPRRILDLAYRGSFELYTSPELAQELGLTLGKPKLASHLAAIGKTPDLVLSDFLGLAVLIDSPPVEISQLRDPKDAIVIACAVSAKAELLVTGDNDLLELGVFRKIAILDPSTALKSMQVT